MKAVLVSYQQTLLQFALQIYCRAILFYIQKCIFLLFINLLFHAISAFINIKQWNHGEDIHIWGLIIF